MLPKLSDQNAELASALADGELSGDELAHAIAWVSQTEEGRRHWHNYHLLGEALRGAQVEVSSHDSVFLARLRERFQHESTSSQGVEAANDVRFHWARLAGVVLVVVGSILGWQSWLDLGDATGQARIARVPAQAPSEAPVTMLRDPQLDALMAAHKQFGGASVLQTPTGFLRNATFQGGAH
jgi:sigma-E factor negative regulatory protein RseA